MGVVDKGAATAALQMAAICPWFLGGEGGGGELRVAIISMGVANASVHEVLTMTGLDPGGAPYYASHLTLHPCEDLRTC